MNAKRLVLALRKIGYTTRPHVPEAGSRPVVSFEPGDDRLLNLGAILALELRESNHDTTADLDELATTLVYGVRDGAVYFPTVPWPADLT